MSAPVLVLGATSGIGRAIAARFAQAGHPLLLAARDRDELELDATDLRVRYEAEVRVLSFDALDFEGHPAFWEQCVRACPDGLYGVVLCFGAMSPQAEAQSDPGVARRMIDVNYTAAVSILTLAADYFEERRLGFLCALSSVAGDRGRQSNYVYGSAKAGLSAFLQGLRQRLSKVDVPVVTVKPGFVDTGMTFGLPGLFLVASPARVAEDVYRAVQKGAGTLYTPWFWWGIMAIIRAVPEKIFNRTKL